MRGSEIGFHELAGQVWMVTVPPDVGGAIAGAFSVGQEVNAALVLGGVHHERGLAFCVLSPASVDEQGQFGLFAPSDAVDMVIPARFLLQEEFTPAGESWLSDPDFAGKAQRFLERVRCSDGVQVTRDFRELDVMRNAEYPDDVLVYLMRGQQEPCGVWVRCEGVRGSRIIGTILSEPEGDFGVHAGQIVAFGFLRDGREMVCAANLDEGNEKEGEKEQ